MKNKVVWSLFDGSGFMGHEYAKAGYTVYCFNADTADHGEYKFKVQHPNIHYVNAWIDGTFDPVGAVYYGPGNVQRIIEKPDIIFAFPSCTFLTAAGSKHVRSQSELMLSIVNAQLVESLGRKYNCPWMVENPVGKMSTLWRKPDYYFDPYEYGGYLGATEGSYHPKMPFQNAYTKKTCIWAGNGFIMPTPIPVPHIGCFWGWKYLGGKSEKTKQLRSLTPEGFARAVFKFNK